MNRASILLLLVIFLSAPPRYALAGDFHPWNADVLTGDRVYHEHETGRPWSRQITAGFQGGAFILIRMFQVFISPQDGGNCRHTPTCSAYAKGAVAKHGALIGSFMAGERLIRCNPFYPPEYDPVPDRIFGE